MAKEIDPELWYAVTEMFRKAREKKELECFEQEFEKAKAYIEKYGKLNELEMGSFRYFFFRGFHAGIDYSKE